MSPVIITTSRPRPCKARIASFDSGLMVSATATIPANFPSIAANIGVLPSEASFSTVLSAPFNSIFRSFIKRKFPSSKSLPETFASMPRPSSALKFSTFSIAKFRLSAPRTIAAASGCSLCFSADATIFKNSFSLQSFETTTSVNSGSPLVIVPVLSSTIVFNLCAVSSESPPLIKIPFSAPRPVPTIIAVGVAKPKAHGQAIISTDTKLTSAIVKRTSGDAATNQITNVAIAIEMTIGVKMPLIVSANFAIGGFEPCASCTSLTICCKAVSFPTLVALKENAPVLLIVAPKISSPVFFSTGRLSPVNIDSSMADEPSTKMPSTGIFSPGRTITISPGTTSSVSISISLPSRITRAVFACKPTSFLIAAPV